MHEQRVGQLCSLGSRGEMHRPQKRECVDGLTCHLIDDKVWPSGVCLHEGVQLRQNIMLGTIGIYCRRFKQHNIVNIQAIHVRQQ
jgi:hypothetical protein